MVLVLCAIKMLCSRIVCFILRNVNTSPGTSAIVTEISNRCLSSGTCLSSTTQLEPTPDHHLCKEPLAHTLRASRLDSQGMTQLSCYHVGSQDTSSTWLASFASNMVQITTHLICLQLIRPDTSASLNSVQTSRFRSALEVTLYVFLDRYDVCYAVRVLAGFMASPTVLAIKGLHRLVKYLMNTAEYGVMLQPKKPSTLFYEKEHEDGDHCIEIYT